MEPLTAELLETPKTAELLETPKSDRDIWRTKNVQGRNARKLVDVPTVTLQRDLRFCTNFIQYSCDYAIGIWNLNQMLT